MSAVQTPAQTAATIDDCDEHGTKHEYLSCLPQTSIRLKSIYGHEFKCPRYWFDYKKLRIVSKTSKKHKYPYLYLRGNTFTFNFKDIGEKRYDADRLIRGINSSYQKQMKA